MNNISGNTPDVYMEEYTRQDIIARYISRSAGVGIAYVLTHVYAPIYLHAIQSLIAASSARKSYRILEYGCGGGMNLLKVMELLQSQGMTVESAFGTDFSKPMIEAAKEEGRRHLPAELMDKVNYLVAANETLLPDLARNTEMTRTELCGTFDFIVGVNTFRYAHRLGKENDCARDIFDLLRPGGYSIMIDMNRLFPFFRSRVRDIVTRPRNEYYLPSLKEYTRPFREVGFAIEESRNFCWIPHSANATLLAVCRTASPILDTFFRPFAMRSLVVAKKSS